MFDTMLEVRILIEQLKHKYNTVRLHSLLGYRRWWSNYHQNINAAKIHFQLCSIIGGRSSLAKLGRGENVITEILMEICLAQDVGIDDIMKWCLI